MGLVWVWPVMFSSFAESTSKGRWSDEEGDGARSCSDDGVNATRPRTKGSPTSAWGRLWGVRAFSTACHQLYRIAAVIPEAARARRAPRRISDGWLGAMTLFRFLVCRGLRGP